VSGPEATVDVELIGDVDVDVDLETPELLVELDEQVTLAVLATNVGPPGPPGPAGPAGPPGAEGAQGPPGAEGAQGPPGATGSPGADGAPGAPGAQGPPGAEGPVGPAGPTGPQGPAGTGINVKGQVPTESDLPAGAAVGDAYVVETTGDLWIWEGSSWVNAGPIQGPEGPQGPQGPQGIEGPQGPSGAPGDQGPTGPPGADGAPGAQGPKGDTGAQGPQGNAGAQGPAGVPGDTVVTTAARVLANYLAAGDAQPTWRLLGSGRMEIGAGGATAADVVLARTGVGTLQYQPVAAGSFDVRGGPSQGTAPVQRWLTSGGQALMTLIPAGVGPTAKLTWRFGSAIQEQDVGGGDPSTRMLIQPNGDRLDVLNEAGTLPMAMIALGAVVFYDGVAGADPANSTLRLLGKNVGFRANSFGGGSGVLAIADAVTVPSSNPTGGGLLYSQAGALKWRKPDGTVQEVGLPGPAGAPGTQGPKGDTGAQGPAGATGAQGPKGDTGDQGPAGAEGPPGLPGDEWVYGTGDPEPSADRVGTLYLDGTTGKVWEQQATGWVFTGITLEGPPGSQILWGFGPPAPGLGKDGDFYIDRDTADTFGKESGAWVFFGNLTGPTGPEGPKGDTGDQGPKGDTGAQGPPGPAGGSAPAYAGTFDLVNNAALTALFTKLLPVLGPNASVFVHIEGDYANTGGTARPIGFAVTLGGVTLWGDTTSGNVPTHANRRAFRFDLHLQNEGSVSQQRAAGTVRIGSTGAGGSGGLGGFGTADFANFVFGGASQVNTGVAQPLAVAAVLGFAASNLELRGSVTVLVYQ
jgi:hypothetical protein